MQNFHPSALSNILIAIRCDIAKLSQPAAARLSSEECRFGFDGMAGREQFRGEMSWKSLSLESL
jgi:hypothetical protein